MLSLRTLLSRTAPAIPRLAATQLMRHNHGSGQPPSDGAPYNPLLAVDTLKALTGTQSAHLALNMAGMFHTVHRLCTTGTRVVTVGDIIGDGLSFGLLVNSGRIISRAKVLAGAFPILDPVSDIMLDGTLDIEGPLEMSHDMIHAGGVRNSLLADLYIVLRENQDPAADAALAALHLSDRFNRGDGPEGLMDGFIAFMDAISEPL